MKRASFVIFGLLGACSSAAVVDDPLDASDASNDARSPAADAIAADADSAAAADIAVSDSDAAESPAPDPCADAGVPASTLACTGLYADFANKVVAANAFAYTPASPLWSDGAQKQRWIELPPHTQIDISNPNEWTFPVGTKFFKEFRVNGQRVETRLFQKVESNFWIYATYAWSSDESSATINFGGPVPVADGGTDGGDTWNIPTNDDCNECHRGRQDRILGFEQVSLGLPNAQGLTLARLAELGLVAPAPPNVSLAIGDDGTSLDGLALGWIHINCGVTCHNSNPSAAGYGAGMLLRLDPTQLDGSPPNAATWEILKTTVDIPCVSGSLLGKPRIRRGDSSHSAIDQLIGQRGALQMPPIASLLVDSPDVAIVASWIQALGASSAEAGTPDAGGRRGNADSGAPDATVVDASEGGPEESEGGELDANSTDADAPDVSIDAADESQLDAGSGATDIDADN